MKLFWRPALFLIILSLSLFAPAQNLDKVDAVTCHLAFDHSTYLANARQTAVLKLTLKAANPPAGIQRSPVNLAIVLDHSGSMSGQKLASAKEGVRQAVGRLSERDRFSLIVYNHKIETVFAAQPVRDITPVHLALERIRPQGDTAIFAGLSLAAAEIRKHLDQNFIHRVVLLSDGIANVGPSSPIDFGRLGIALSKENISVSTVGVGNDYNEDLMVQLSQGGQGTNYYAENPRDLPAIFNGELGDVLNVVATNLEVEIHFEGGLKPRAVIGRDGQVRERRATIPFQQLYGGQEAYALVEVDIPAYQQGQPLPTATGKIVYTNALNQARETRQTSVAMSFSESRERVAQSVNPSVEQSVQLNYNAMIQDRAVELADQGNIGQAIQELQQSSQKLKQVGTKNQDPVLIEKAAAMDKLAEEIGAQGLSKQNRKMLRNDSYVERVNQATMQNSYFIDKKKAQYQKADKKGKKDQSP